MTCKNSFLRGLSEGFCNKLKNEKELKHSKELIVIEKKLEQKMKMAYPSLRSSKTRYRHCRESETLGKDAGAKMNIRPGINKENHQSSTKYIS